MEGEKTARGEENFAVELRQVLVVTAKLKARGARNQHNVRGKKKGNRLSRPIVNG